MEILELSSIDLSWCKYGALPEYPGWDNPLIRDGTFIIVKDDGNKVLANKSGSVQPVVHCWTTGDPLWRDYTIEADVKQLSDHVLWLGDEVDISPSGRAISYAKARTGLIARYRHLRCYYYYCIEDLDKLVLYRRIHNKWSILGETGLTVDPRRYYTLRMDLKGDRIVCHLNGRVIFDVKDNTLPSGKVGIRSSAESRIRNVKVYTSKDAHRRFLQERKAYTDDLKSLRKRYPQPLLWRKIDLGLVDKDSTITLADIRKNGEMNILLTRGSDVTVMDLDGDILWKCQLEEGVELPKRGRQIRVYDIDGDGLCEIISCGEEELLILDIRTGRIKAEASIPTIDSPIGSRRVIPQHIYITNLLSDKNSQVVLMGGGYQGVWAYDHKLETILALPNVKIGHHLSFADFDDDGLQEIIASHTCIDGDGSILWMTEGSWRRTQPYHVDCPLAGEITGGSGDPHVAMACGDMGFLLVDREGRVVAEQRLGHVQHLSVGKYRRDLPGLQIWTGTRWHNYGIRTLLDSRGRILFEFEPDYGEDPGLPINWTGDGEELVYHKNLGGLYDAFGRKVVEFPKGLTPIQSYPPFEDVTGDQRDELFFQRDNFLYIYTQDRPFTKDSIYAPIRRWSECDWGVLSHPRWEETKPR